MNKLLLKLLLRHPSKTKTDQGFSLFEVTIAILVSSAFLMGTLQAMTINAVLQIKSERQAQANFLIQQDGEKLQATASSVGIEYVEKNEDATLKALLNPDGKSQTQLCWRYDADPNKAANIRFGADLVKVLDHMLENDKNPDGTLDTTTKSDSKTKTAIENNQVFSGAAEFKQFETDADGNVLFTNGTPVLDINQDSVPSNGNKKVAVQIVKEIEILNKPYRVVRLMTVDSSSRYDVLQVYYRVGEPHYDPPKDDYDGKDENNDQLRDDEPGRKSIIAENYTEVIPAAVPECGFSPS